MRFKIDDLPTLVKDMYKTQTDWRNKNYKKTLLNHSSQIENIFETFGVFDEWFSCLHNDDVAMKLLPEMYFDAYASITYSCFAMYKYAYMCLRSELETALRLIFFSNHHVEFNWWLKNTHWYMKRNPDQVWGRDYTYFTLLDKVKEFDGECEENDQLFRGSENIRRVYARLSRYIHSGADFFQTEPYRLSPNYNLGKVNQWSDMWKRVQCYINILLLLSYIHIIKDSNDSYNKIIELSISDNYKGILRNMT